MSLPIVVVKAVTSWSV
jgi:hypothetical protein